MIEISYYDKRKIVRAVRKNVESIILDLAEAVVEDRRLNFERLLDPTYVYDVSRKYGLFCRTANKDAKKLASEYIKLADSIVQQRDPQRRPNRFRKAAAAKKLFRGRARSQNAIGA
jgi:hypothetical protein